MKIKYITILIVFLIMLSFFTVFYGKTTIKSINYEKFYNESVYNYMSESKIYNYYPELKNFLIDTSKIDSLNSLIKLSDYVLIIRNSNESILHGKSIINSCIIKKIIKGNDLSVNQKIKIYDLNYEWNMKWTSYLGGSTPMLPNEDYLVFINKNIYPSIDNTYTFSNVRYGHIRLNGKNKYLQNVAKYTISMKEISDYDYVFEEESTEEEINIYKKIIDEVQKLAD